MRAGLLPIGDECVSRGQIAAVSQALRDLVCLDMDMARVKNGVGFSKFDTSKGWDLAIQTLSEDGLSKSEFLAAKKLLRKYRRQIDPDLYRIIYGDDPAA